MVVYFFRSSPRDTIGRYVCQSFFGYRFSKWAQAVNRASGGKLIAIDGKTIRRSFNAAAKKSAIHLVSAWSIENQVVLAQVKVSEKSNEIKAIPKLLDLLSLEGTTVTVDAMGCQRDIPLKIVDKGADYFFSLKGNQKTIQEEVIELFDDARKSKFKELDHDTWEITEKGHGRIGEKTSEETRYFLSSLPQDAEKFAKTVRGHWSIENGLHWCLDVVMQEDLSNSVKECGRKCRGPKKNRPQSFQESAA